MAENVKALNTDTERCSNFSPSNCRLMATRLT